MNNWDLNKLKKFYNANKITIKNKKNNIRKRGIKPLGYYVMMWRKSDVTKSQIKAFEQRRFLDHNAILRNRMRKKGLWMVNNKIQVISPWTPALCSILSAP